ncbi:MAG: hypothetical protein D6678_04035 [Zetaproteobacteria bacterium]|nr:MAG: hypothetical protein D6678_04035 [Zetaproteobacteria bacterium]
MLGLRCLFMLLLMLSTVGCSLKKSTEVYTHLWQTWEAMDTLVQPDFPDAPPIILIHGWNGGEFTWPDPASLSRLEQQLRRDIYLFTYRTGIVANRYPPIEILEEKLDRFLGRYPTVDVVAHSMGGLLLRQYLSHHPSDPVRRIVFLSTPHFGTHAARLLAGLGELQAEGNIQAQEIQPGSDFLWQLNAGEGEELQGHAVLNVYVAEHDWFRGDIVVDPASAWLPWGVNIAVAGDHHLGRRLLELPRVLDFLRDGRLPATVAPMPTEHKAWLRFVVGSEHLAIGFNDSHVQHIDAQGHARDDFTVCCKARSGLYPLGGSTLVLEHVQPGDVYLFHPRRKGCPAEVRISGDALRSPERPVVLKEWLLDAP